MTSPNGNIFSVICEGVPPVTGGFPLTGRFPHKGQWRGALMFSLICVWTKGSLPIETTVIWVALIMRSLQCKNWKIGMFCAVSWQRIEFGILFLEFTGVVSLWQPINEFRSLRLICTSSYLHHQIEKKNNPRNHYTLFRVRSWDKSYVACVRFAMFLLSSARDFWFGFDGICAYIIVIGIFVLLRF